ncbi:hypothetical protein [Actinoplanes sp. M2I2]|uniref:hypothetical protein n=1 Tax=Actinoplanes sp. M2I2 TaxID=1734444 RepID=UPI002020BD6A|nr:hypothetical protein [Actinoplanes sp. M2I2]
MAMGMMTDYRWRRGAAAFALTLPIWAATGCEQRSSLVAESSPAAATGSDASGREACAEFQSGWRRAADTPARLQLADSVDRRARRSDSAAIAESVAALGRSADDGDRAWRAAASDLLRACRQAGSSTTAPTLPVTG